MKEEDVMAGNSNQSTRYHNHPPDFHLQRLLLNFNQLEQGKLGAYFLGRLLLLQMPLQNPLENALSTRIDGVTMARNHAVKIPLIDFADRVAEASPVAAGSGIPDESLLSVSVCVGQRAEDLSQDAALRIHIRLAELLSRGIVEQKVGLDKCLCWLVVEDNFLVRVCIDVFIVELGIEFRGNGGDGLVLAENEGEGNVFVTLLLALLRESLGAQNLGLGIGLVPWSEEDVVLHAGFRWRFLRYRYADIGHTSASRAVMYFTSPISATFFLTSSVRATGEKTARAPDCKRTAYWSATNGLSMPREVHTNCASTANLYPAKPPKRSRKGRDDVGDNIANNHHLCRVGRNQLGGHFGFVGAQ